MSEPELVLETSVVAPVRTSVEAPCAVGRVRGARRARDRAGKFRFGRRSAIRRCALAWALLGSGLLATSGCSDSAARPAGGGAGGDRASSDVASEDVEAVGGASADDAPSEPAPDPDPATIPDPPVIEDLAAHEIDPASIERIENALAEVRRSPTSALAWLKLGMEYQANEMNAQAAPCYRQSIALDPEEPRSHYYLARIEAGAGRLDEAADAMRAALVLEPDYPASHWRLGQILLEQGDLAGAQQGFEEALALDATSEAARIGLARVALQEARPEDALRELDTAIALEGRNAAYAQRLRAQALQRLGRSEEVELLRVSFGNRSRIGERLLRAGQTEDGVAVLEALRDDHPDEPGVLINLGVGYAMLGRMDEAIATFEAYLEHDPEHAITHENLARALLRKGLQLPAEDPEREAGLSRALEHAERAASIATGSAAAQALRGDILRRQGRLEAAAAAYAAAAELDPNDARIQDARSELDALLEAGGAQDEG